MTWLQRIFRKKEISSNANVRTASNHIEGQNIAPSTGDDSTEELNEKLQSGIYESIEDKNSD